MYYLLVHANTDAYIYMCIYVYVYASYQIISNNAMYAICVFFGDYFVLCLFVFHPFGWINSACLCFTHPVDAIPAPGRDFQLGRISDLGKHLNDKEIIWNLRKRTNALTFTCHGVPWCAMMCHDVPWCAMMCPCFFSSGGGCLIFSQCICFLFQKDLWHQDVCAPRIATVIVCDLHWCLNSLRRHRAESRLCWFQDGSTPKIICGYLAYRNQ